MACVCTIGFFDGVHLGHQHLIKQLCQIGKEKHLPAHIITFSHHPRSVCMNTCIKLLSTQEEKTLLLQKMGIATCHILDFTPEVAKLSAHDFMQQYLKEKYDVKTLLVGFNHHFGHPAQGEGFEQYCAYGKEMDIDVIEATPFQELSEDVSSSTIRKELEKANIRQANLLLGHPYSFSATVVHGRSIGRKLGFPTANLQPTDSLRLIPPSGCYAVRIIIDSKSYAGMLYIGARPTFQNENDQTPSIEVNLFDFNEEIYHKTVTIEFHDLLRGEKRFDSIEDLQIQLEKDRQHTLEILKTSQYNNL